jgi:hypothetical protein
MQMELITECSPGFMNSYRTETSPPTGRKGYKKQVLKCEVGNSVGLLSLPIRLGALTLEGASQHSFSDCTCFASPKAFLIAKHRDLLLIF